MIATRSRTTSTGSESSVTSNTSTSIKRRRDKSDSSRAKATKKSKNNPPAQNMATEVPIPTSVDDKFTYLVEQMKLVTSSNHQTNERVNALLDEINIMKDTQKNTDKKVDKLERHVVKLEETVANLETENNQLNQKALEKEFVIFGLPKFEKSEMENFVKKLSSQSKVEFTQNDLETIYAVPMRNKKDAVIVHGRFFDHRLKSEFISGCIKNKPLVTEDVLTLKSDDPSRGKQIFVRSQLTATNQKISAEANLQRRKGNLAYAYERNGRILVKKDEKSPFREIRTMKQLMQLINPAANNQRIEVTESEQESMDEN